MVPNETGDPNMELARLFAEKLGPAPPLPASLKVVTRRAELVHAIDGPLVTGGDLHQVVTQIATQIRRVAEGSRDFLQDISDPMVRINIALRLWAGCLSGAKVIAHETRSGPNTPEYRRRIMPQLEVLADRDPIYAAGLEAAQAFKRLRRETYSLDGVPENARVRMDA